jgi:hypothetical protein
MYFMEGRLYLAGMAARLIGLGYGVPALLEGGIDKDTRESKRWL